MSDPETTWTRLSETGQAQQLLSLFGSGNFGDGGFGSPDTIINTITVTSWIAVPQENGNFVPYSATGFRTVIGGYGHGTYGHGKYGVGSGQRVVRNADLSTAWSQTATK